MEMTKDEYDNHMRQARQLAKLIVGIPSDAMMDGIGMDATMADIMVISVMHSARRIFKKGGITSVDEDATKAAAEEAERVKNTRRSDTAIPAEPAEQKDTPDAHD